MLKILMQYKFVKTEKDRLLTGSKDGKLLPGFTIIELVVVMAVFLFIIGAAIGIFISIVLQQKRVLAEQQLINQISYVEEYMSKALRMAKPETDESCLVENSVDYQGYIYLLTHKDTICGSSDPMCGLFAGIKFINQSDNNTCQEFFLENGVLQEVKGAGLPAALTPANLKINFVRFAVNGDANNCDGATPCGASNNDAANNSVQPRVTILINVSIPGEPARTIQTTVSQRNLNVKM